MKKQIQCIVVLFILLTLLNGLAYSAGELFRSVASGNWNSTSTWQMSTDGGGSWVAATLTPDNTSNIITIQSPNTVTVTADVNVDELTVNNGGQISIDNTVTLTILDGSGNDFTLSLGGTISGPGTLRTQGANISMSTSGDFSVHLKVNSGLTTTGGIFNGPITIDPGTQLDVGSSGNPVQATNNVINNGTIGGTNGATFKITGSSLVNNGTIQVPSLDFDATTSVSGSGIYFNGPFSSTTVRISSTGNISLSSNMTLSNASVFVINTGGVLNPNGNIFTLKKELQLNGGTISNSGTFQTQETVNMTINSGSNFMAPLKVDSGLTTVFGNSAIFNGPITIDAGTQLDVGSFGNFIQANSDVNNNGTIGGNSASEFRMQGSILINNGIIQVPNFNFETAADTLLNTGTINGGTSRFFGTTFINNGNVTASTFNFETGAHTLQGTGYWSTEAQVLNGSTTTLLSNHQMSSVTIHAGGTFDITSRTLFVSRNGVPIGVIGSMITGGSTIEYNGTTGQGVQTSNLVYNNLTINNSAGVNLPAIETVPGILALTSGTFSIVII